jgi:nucleotide-binding universal stress UspA family protein
VFSTIVVGTDGSETAALAVKLAADLAKQHNAVLHLVNAYKVPTGGVAVVQAGAMAVADPGVSSEVLKGASEKTLAEAAQSTDGAKVEVHSVVGAPADVVISVAEEVNADLIVVGSKGMRGARRVLGSVPNTIAHRGPCHVLIAKTA